MFKNYIAKFFSFPSCLYWWWMKIPPQSIHCEFCDTRRNVVKWSRATESEGRQQYFWSCERCLIALQCKEDAFPEKEERLQDAQ